MNRFQHAPALSFAFPTAVAAIACGLFAAGASAKPVLVPTPALERPAAVAPAAASSTEDESFRCPGTNAAFFEEIREAGWVGIGETWDFNTCNDERALEIYGEGATGAWPAFRRPRKAHAVALKVRPSGKPVNVEFYATVLPWVAFGTIGVVIGLAWLLALFSRRRRIVVIDVACPKCTVDIPVPLNDPDSRSLFCPACGGSSVIVTIDDAGIATPEVTLL